MTHERGDPIVKSHPAQPVSIELGAFEFTEGDVSTGYKGDVRLSEYHGYPHVPREIMRRVRFDARCLYSIKLEKIERAGEQFLMRKCTGCKIQCVCGSCKHFRPALRIKCSVIY